MSCSYYTVTAKSDNKRILKTGQRKMKSVAMILWYLIFPLSIFAFYVIRTS